MKKYFAAASLPRIAVVAVIAVISAALFACSGCAHFIRTGNVSSESTRRLALADLAGYTLTECGPGCENLWLDPDSNRVYVTSLNGLITLLDGPSPDALAKVRTLHAGGYALGIDRGPDGNLYAAVSPGATMKEWQESGGYVARLGADLESATAVTGSWPCINGFAFDGAGSGYLATSNFSFTSPKGKIVRFTLPADGGKATDETVVATMGLANGLSYDRYRNAVLYSDTLETTGMLAPAGSNDPGGSAGSLDPQILYRKTKFKEAFDDLCASMDGRLWMTDAIRGGLKAYDPETDSLVRYRIDGMGQLSSCRIRIERGREILYCTELVSPTRDRKHPYSGRGVYRIPLESFPE